MNIIIFHGSIWTDDYTVMVGVLRNWVNSNEVAVKLRLTGEEIVYDSSHLYLYCYNANTHEGVEPSFLLEGNLSGTLDQAKQELQTLAQLCTDKNIEADLEYVEVDEDGNEISEQFNLE